MLIKELCSNIINCFGISNITHSFINATNIFINNFNSFSNINN